MFNPLIFLSLSYDVSHQIFTRVCCCVCVHVFIYIITLQFSQGSCDTLIHILYVYFNSWDMARYKVLYEGKGQNQDSYEKVQRHKGAPDERTYLSQSASKFWSLNTLRNCLNVHFTDMFKWTSWLKIIVCCIKFHGSSLQGSKKQWAVIGSDNSLAPNRLRPKFTVSFVRPVPNEAKVQPQHKTAKF